DAKLCRSGLPNAIQQFCQVPQVNCVVGIISSNSDESAENVLLKILTRVDCAIVVRAPEVPPSLVKKRARNHHEVDVRHIGLGVVRLKWAEAFLRRHTETVLATSNYCDVRWAIPKDLTKLASHILVLVTTS